MKIWYQKGKRRPEEDKTCFEVLTVGDFYELKWATEVSTFILAVSELNSSWAAQRILLCCIYSAVHIVLVTQIFVFLSLHQKHVFFKRNKQTRFSSPRRSPMFRRLWFNHFILGDRHWLTSNTLGRLRRLVFTGHGSVFLIQFIFSTICYFNYCNCNFCVYINRIVFWNSLPL